MSDLDLVPLRRLLVAHPRVRIELFPGDHVTVAEGALVAVGDLLAERVRDPRLVESPIPKDAQGAPLPGSWHAAEAGRAGRSAGSPAGEVLYVHEGRRRIASGARPDLVHAPASGRVAAIEPGAGILLDASGVGLAGTVLLGEPNNGRLAMLPEDADPRLALDVGMAGTIIGLPGRADAEVLARARAMGIHGAVVGSLAERDRRDLASSEARQRAGMHRLTPFAVLVLDGYLRRPVASAVRSILDALDGREVGLVGGPALLVADPPLDGLPLSQPDRVRVRGGAETGREGRWLGPAGLRRFRAGVVAEAGLVALDDGRTVAIPIGELERFA